MLIKEKDDSQKEQQVTICLAPNRSIEMMDAGRSCLELAQQLHAVEKAIQQAKRVLVQDHIEHCLDDAIGPLEPDQQKRIDEFKAIAHYL